MSLANLTLAIDLVTNGRPVVHRSFRRRGVFDYYDGTNSALEELDTHELAADFLSRFAVDGTDFEMRTILVVVRYFELCGMRPLAKQPNGTALTAGIAARDEESFETILKHLRDQWNAP